MVSTLSQSVRRRAAFLVPAAVAAVVASSLVFGGSASAQSLGDYPLRVVYELSYQSTPDRSDPLVEARAEWIVRSPSDWEFTILTGPDAGTTYRLDPSGEYSVSDGRSQSTLKQPSGSSLVPLPDLAMDGVVRLAASDAPVPAGIAVERTGQAVDRALDEVAALTGFGRDHLQAAVISRESSTDAFTFDSSTDQWVGEPGTVVETVVVDSSAPGVLLRTQTFEGELIRHIAVVSVEKVK
jgi:hypothetical protein